MSSIFSPTILSSALELGITYSLVALALFLSYGILKIADLSTDGCFTLGCAVGVQITIMGHPFLALFAAMAVGVLSGYIAAFLQTKVGVEPILAGIVVNTGLYSINIAAMGFSSQLSIFKKDTIFSLAKDFLGATWYKVIVALIIVALIAVALVFFLNTKLGLSIRATGDNKDMVRASSINPGLTITIGLCISGSFTALSGSLYGMICKSCSIDNGIGMVTIALASLIIGETIFGKYSIPIRVIGVIIGSCLYRYFIAIALAMHAPIEFLKLISALIVAVAISAPAVKQRIQLNRQKAEAQKMRMKAIEEEKALQKGEGK